ncbi:uncharacterized protein V1516DRAFT_680641 [Lipomyces oligophaga]|uniref:uncharacterized protein n=1 Tax=Lipomyces oligophaga TaxID=45792 RepID=UPI0034CDA447
MQDMQQLQLQMRQREIQQKQQLAQQQHQQQQQRNLLMQAHQQQAQQLAQQVAMHQTDQKGGEGGSSMQASPSMKMEKANEMEKPEDENLGKFEDETGNSSGKDMKGLNSLQEGGSVSSISNTAAQNIIQGQVGSPILSTTPPPSQPSSSVSSPRMANKRRRDTTGGSSNGGLTVGSNNGTMTNAPSTSSMLSHSTTVGDGPGTLPGSAEVSIKDEDEGLGSRISPSLGNKTVKRTKINGS